MKLKTLFAVAAVALLSAGCLGDSTGSGVTVIIPPPEPLAAGIDTVTTASGLKYADIVVGTGTTVQSGRAVQLHYTGWLLNGTGFDTTVGFQPATVVAGDGRFIAGWNEGLVGMKVGGKRRLIIPPALAYGANEVKNQETGAVVIPANSTLIFDIQVLAASN